MKADNRERVAIIGAGMGGLSAAIALSARGYLVDVFENHAWPGGKARPVSVDGATFDGGPTVMTMKWVFDELLARCGTSLEDEIGLTKVDCLARHYWSGGERLDLFADLEASVDAIGQFSGRKDAAGYRRFAADSEAVFNTLQRTYIDAPRPSPFALARRIGLGQPGKLLALKPFSSLWRALDGYFHDPRLKQLFGRYATYCGSSPYLSPATLMLVAHVEREGVWIVDGGMRALAGKLSEVAERFGTRFHFSTGIEHVEKRPDGFALHVAGEKDRASRTHRADRVIFNGDIAALPALLAKPVRRDPYPPHKRSLSALVHCSVARTSGVPLAHHTVFFSDDYEAEFDAIFKRRQAPADPTIYVCAPDRDDRGNQRPADDTAHDPERGERIYTLMNLPADGDRHSPSESELDQWMTATQSRLLRNGLKMNRKSGNGQATNPTSFNQLFPQSCGALYGMASHGWTASFSRKGSKGPIPGLYLAGGSVHPGPGVPMAALSGKLAAQSLMSDLISTAR